MRENGQSRQGTGALEKGARQVNRNGAVRHAKSGSAASLAASRVNHEAQHHHLRIVRPPFTGGSACLVPRGSETRARLRPEPQPRRKAFGAGIGVADRLQRLDPDFSDKKIKPRSPTRHMHRLIPAQPDTDLCGRRSLSPGAILRLLPAIAHDRAPGSRWLCCHYR